MPAVSDLDVFSLAEIAAAARVADAVVLDLAARGSLPTVGPATAPLEALVTREVAVEAVRALAAGATVGGGARAAVAVAAEVARPSGVSGPRLDRSAWPGRARRLRRLPASAGRCGPRHRPTKWSPMNPSASSTSRCRDQAAAAAAVDCDRSCRRPRCSGRAITR